MACEGGIPRGENRMQTQLICPIHVEANKKKTIDQLRLSSNWQCGVTRLCCQVLPAVRQTPRNTPRAIPGRLTSQTAAETEGESSHRGESSHAGERAATEAKVDTQRGK